MQVAQLELVRGSEVLAEFGAFRDHQFGVGRFKVLAELDGQLLLQHKQRVELLGHLKKGKKIFRNGTAFTI